MTTNGTGCALFGKRKQAWQMLKDQPASPGLELALIRPARKNQLGLECHGGRVPAGLWARIVQHLLALNAAIWHNWQIGAPIKRSLIAYDH